MVQVPTLPSVSPLEGLTAAPPPHSPCSVTFPFLVLSLDDLPLLDPAPSLLEPQSPAALTVQPPQSILLHFVFGNNTNHFVPWQLWQNSRIELLMTTVLFSEAPALWRGIPPLHFALRFLLFPSLRFVSLFLLFKAPCDPSPREAKNLQNNQTSPNWMFL